MESHPDSPAPLPTPDPAFSGLGLAPIGAPIDTLDKAASEAARYPEIRRNVVRWKRLEEIMSLAERKRGKPLDPMIKQWLMSVIEPQEDGKELFLPANGTNGAGPEKISAKMRKAKNDEQLSVSEAKKRSGGEIQALFDSLDATQKTLSTIDLSKLDAGLKTKIQALNQTIIGVQAQQDDIQAFRGQIDDAMFLLLEALIDGKTKGELREQIESSSFNDRLKILIRIKVPNLKNPGLVDQEFVTEIAKDFRSTLLVDLDKIRVETGVILGDVQTAKTKSELDELNITSDLGTARRAFNNKFAGTDAETILNFSAVDKTIDLTILEKQLNALGWNDPADADARVQQLVTLISGEHNADKRYMLTDDSTAKLLDFITKKTTENPSGFSINVLNQRVKQFGILREWSEEKIKAEQSKSKDGEVDIAKVVASIKIDFPTFTADASSLLHGIDPAKTGTSMKVNKEQVAGLAQELAKKIVEQLDNDETIMGKVNGSAKPLSLIGLKAEFPGLAPVTNDQILALGLKEEDAALIIPPDIQPILIAFIRQKQVENMTKKTEVTVPISQLFKDYASDAAGLTGSALTVWGNWIASLRHTVLPTLHDGKLLEALDTQQNLEEIEDALSDIGVWKDGKVEDGSLINDLGGTMQRSQKDMETALRDEAKASSLTKPTKDYMISVENAGQLGDVGEFVLKELQIWTRFEDIRDPVTRHRAFLVAMYYGIDDAKLYIRCPESYELENGDKMSAILPAERRYLESLVAQGDLLGSLKLYGLDIDPRALSIMRETPIPGTCDTITLDCPADGLALALILRENRDPNVAEKPMLNNQERPLINKLIQVYTQRQDAPGLTVEEANRIVDGIRLHLAKQDADAQELTDTKTDHRFDPLKTVNAAYEAVKSMIHGDTFAEKALGWALIGGAAYGIIKAWPKHWKLIMTAPMLLGANIALKRMTGKSAGDYLNLQFMDEKHRNTSYEQFIRRNRFVEGFEEVEEDTGRAAMSILTDDTDPIPIEELLFWRKKMKAAGPKDFAADAPKKLKGKLRLIINEMGTSKTEHLPADKLREEALRIALLAFKAQCVDVNRARGLGGSNIIDQEQTGADYIRRMYTSLKPDCHTRFPDPPPIVGICGIPPCKCFTMRHILTFERPSEALMKPMETWTEAALSKAGIGAAAVADGIRSGLTTLEIRKNKLLEDAPDDLDWAKTNIMESWKTFERWVQVTYAKIKPEMLEDLSATWEFLSGTAMAAGFMIKENGPGAVEWVYDYAVLGVEMTRDSALSVYRGLKKIHVTGPFLVGLEELIAKELAPVAELELADITDIDTFKKSIIDVFADKISAGDIQGFLDKVMGTTLLNIEAEKHLPSRALKLELLKRSLYSYLIASRMRAIEMNPAQPNIQSPLHADFSTLSIDTNTYKLTDIRNPPLEDFYNHIFSHYDPKRAGILIGQDRALGIKLDEAAMQDGALGTGAAVLNWFGDNILWDTSGDYLKGSLAAYLDPIMKEAKKSLMPDQAELFRSYVETLLMNVVVEMTLSDEDPNVAPLHLTVKRAKDYLSELQTKRGGVPGEVLKEDYLKIEPALKLYEMTRTPSVAVEHLRRDPVAADHLGGGLGRLATLPHTPFSAPSTSPTTTPSTPSTSPASPTSPSMGPATGPASVPATDIDAILGKSGVLTPDDQAKLLQAYPTAGSKQGDIQDKFDALLQNKLKATPDLTSAGRLELLNAYIGVSDSYGGIGWAVGTYRSEAEELFLERFKSPADLTFVAHEYSVASDPAKSRLLSLAKRSLGARLSEEFNVAKANPSAATPNAKQYLDAAQDLDSLAKDRASMLMEYIFCRGDYTTRTFDEYQRFAPSIDYSGAQFRFSRASKLPVRTFETYFDALK